MKKRKTIRGNTLGAITTQVNLKVIKYGSDTIEKALGVEKKEEPTEEETKEEPKEEVKEEPKEEEFKQDGYVIVSAPKKEEPASDEEKTVSELMNEDAEKIYSEEDDDKRKKVPLETDQVDKPESNAEKLIDDEEKETDSGAEEKEI